MIIEVCNLQRTPFGQPGDLRCDRQTKWGNPFVLYYEKDRDRVCDLYEDYLEEITTPNNESMVRKFLKIGGLTPVQIDIWMNRTGGFLDIKEIKDARRLFCHCAPKRCHCDHLKRKIQLVQEPILLGSDNR
jgi:Domain of unknown function (DUF4326)